MALPPLVCAGVLEDNLQRIRHFTKLDGLSHNAVFCIAQDQRGIIWAGTKSGLNCYDGYRFRVFRNLQPEGPVWNNHIEALSPWGDSIMLVGHRGGLSMVNVYTLKWRHILLPKPLNSENIKRVFSVKPLDKFRVFISGGMGVYLYDSRKPKVVKLISDVIANRFLITNSGDYHYFSAFYGLYQLNKLTLKVDKIYLNPVEPVQGPIAQLKDGRILSGGWANGLIVWNPFTKQIEKIKLKCLNGSLNEKFVSFQFAALTDGRIAITSFGNGVLIVNPEDWTATILKSADPKYRIPFFIENYGLLVDNQGLLWVSTDKGLSVISTKRHFLKRIPIHYISKFPEIPDYYQMMVLNSDWLLGNGYSGVYAISRNNGKCWLLNNHYRITDGAVFNCFRIKENEVLLTGYMGIAKLKVKYSNADTVVFHEPECRYPQLKSFQVLQLDSMRYVLGTVGHQVMYYHWGKDSLVFRTAKELNLPSINFSGGGVGTRAIWFNIHHNGLGQLDTNTLSWKSIRFPGDYNRSSYDMPTLSAVREMPNGNLWVGTEESGVWFLDGHSKKWIHLVNNQEVPHNRVINIFPDSFLNVWIQTNTGFLVYLKQKLDALKQLNVFDGIEDEENTSNAIIDKNELVFIDPKFIYTLSIPEFFKKKSAPVASIAAIRMNGKEINAPIDANYTLQTSANTLELDLTSGVLIDATKIRYSYRFVNKSNEWQSITEGRTITLSYLPPGKYQLEFAGQYESEPKGKSSFITIEVKAPFYTTWWFLLGSTLFLGSIVYSYWRIKMKRKKELEKVRQRIASDLHDDLGATLSSVNILTELAKRKPENASELLNRIGNSTQEMMERVSDIVWSIKPTNDALPELVARMREFAAQTLEAMGIELTFKVTGDLQQAAIPMDTRQHLYLLFKEIVNNAAKHSAATEMSIALRVDSKSIAIDLSDNGCGFDLQKVRKGGNGVSNIHQRAAQIQAECELHSKPGLGTHWKLRFKLPS